MFQSQTSNPPGLDALSSIFQKGLIKEAVVVGFASPGITFILTLGFSFLFPIRRQVTAAPRLEVFAHLHLPTADLHRHLHRYITGFKEETAPKKQHC